MRSFVKQKMVSSFLSNEPGTNKGSHANAHGLTPGGFVPTHTDKIRIRNKTPCYPFPITRSRMVAT
jgi:hypothetical protein